MAMRRLHTLFAQDSAAIGGTQSHDTLCTRQMLLPTELPRQFGWPG